MTAQSLLVVLREQEELYLQQWGDRLAVPGPFPEVLEEKIKLAEVRAAIRVIEEVLRSTRETRKEFGDPTLEAATGSGGDLDLGSSTPS